MKNLTIGIIGLGLIGGSLAKSVRAHYPHAQIIGYDKNEESIQLALSSQTINKGITSISEDFTHCQVIFLCLPVKSNLLVLDELKAFVDSECIITDVGSTKSDIIDWINQNEYPAQFIGGHPMTGSERSGFEAAKSYLFENAYYILCPSNSSHDQGVDFLEQLIQSLGAITVVLNAKKHDEITACISHVPHILASLLVNTVKDKDSTKKHMHMLAAGGFKDITRIASSSPEMWQHISLSNRDQIDNLLNYLQDEIGTLRQQLLKEDDQGLYSFFESAKLYRDSFEERALNPMFTTYELKLDVEDRPGMIARVATLLSQHGFNIKNIGILNNREHEQGILEITFYDKENRDLSAKLLTEHQYTVYI